MSEESIWYYVSKGDYSIHPVQIEWSDEKYIKRPERKKATVKDCSWHYYAPTLKDAVQYVVDRHLHLLRLFISEALELEHALEELKTLYPDETQMALGEHGTQANQEGQGTPAQPQHAGLPPAEPDAPTAGNSEVLQRGGSVVNDRGLL